MYIFNYYRDDDIILQRLCTEDLAEEEEVAGAVDSEVEVVAGVSQEAEAVVAEVLLVVEEAEIAEDLAVVEVAEIAEGSGEGVEEGSVRQQVHTCPSTTSGILLAKSGWEDLERKEPGNKIV